MLDRSWARVAYLLNHGCDLTATLQRAQATLPLWTPLMDPLPGHIAGSLGSAPLLCCPTTDISAPGVHTNLGKTMFSYMLPTVVEGVYSCGEPVQGRGEKLVRQSCLALLRTPTPSVVGCGRYHQLGSEDEGTRLQLTGVWVLSFAQASPR